MRIPGRSSTGLLKHATAKLLNTDVSAYIPISTLCVGRFGGRDAPPVRTRVSASFLSFFFPSSFGSCAFGSRVGASARALSGIETMSAAKVLALSNIDFHLLILLEFVLFVFPLALHQLLLERPARLRAGLFHFLLVLLQIFVGLRVNKVLQFLVRDPLRLTHSFLENQYL